MTQPQALENELVRVSDDALAELKRILEAPENQGRHVRLVFQGFG